MGGWPRDGWVSVGGGKRQPANSGRASRRIGDRRHDSERPGSEFAFHLRCFADEGFSAAVQQLWWRAVVWYTRRQRDSPREGKFAPRAQRSFRDALSYPA